MIERHCSIQCVTFQLPRLSWIAAQKLSPCGKYEAGGQLISPEFPRGRWIINLLKHRYAAVQHDLRSVEFTESTILVGMASQEQFDAALSAVEKGPLPQAALVRILARQAVRKNRPQ